MLVRRVYHLLISPLRELGVGGVVVGILRVHLALGRVAVERVRLLVGILVERRVVLLLRVRRPPRLLLLHWVRVWLLARGGRCRGGIVGRRGALAGGGGIDGVGRRVHLQISRWMPVLGSENGHGPDAA